MATKIKYFFVGVTTIFFLLFTGCEVFVIKGKKVILEENPLEYTQNTPLGVVSLFVNELNNNNVLAATELMAKQNRTLYSAAEKYEISAEVSRLKRFISGKEITNSSVDFIDDDLCNVTLEFDYIQKTVFKVIKIGAIYFIADYDKI